MTGTIYSLAEPFRTYEERMRELRQRLEMLKDTAGIMRQMQEENDRKIEETSAKIDALEKRRQQNEQERPQ